MSVIISYVSSSISIIATDTRYSHGENMDNVFMYTDNNEKLYNLPNIGWAAGAGITEFTCLVKESLSKAKITSSNDIADVFNQCHKKIVEKSIYCSEDIKRTVTAISWFGVRNGSMGFRIGILLPEDAWLINYNNINIIYPMNYINNKNLIQELKKKFNFEYEYDGDFKKILKIILNIFDGISNNSDSVSRTCDIGMHMLYPMGTKKLRITGNIEELLKEIGNDTIENRIVIV